jgi:hypothetical protein
MTVKDSLNVFLVILLTINHNLNSMHLMKKMIFLYVFSFLFPFIGCSPKQAKVSNSKYCSNELSLLSISDSLKKIKINYSLEEQPLLNSIAKKLEKNLCWKTIHFGLVLGNEDAINVYLQRECDKNIVSCYNRGGEASILLNKNGHLLLEYEIVSIDSVKYWMQKNFLNTNENHYKKVSIRWDTKTPKDSIEKAFINVMDGYFLKYEDLSQQLFSKKVCDLETSQINILKKKLPFKLRLQFGEQFLTPPPPPIEVIEK